MTVPLDPLDDLTAFRGVAAERLGSFEHETVPDKPGLRRAGVVLCAVEHDGAPAVIVIKRAYRGRNAGQWGLPGGRLEDGETPEEAALRELHEEIGVRAGPGDIVGRLDDFPATSGFSITPVVVVLDDPGPLTPSPDEVHSVHHATLRKLAADDTPRWVPQPDGGRLLQMWLAPQWRVHAPTGALLWQFREVVLLGRHARVADFVQPDWTRE
ncbi:NUDIX hydrolase [Actinomadura livida]|uniref:8-oxo-dGTP pyrophosphatase MutT (NUDIX family) n=1 Tax=Actinomadura livida TaxID=79909 RepID=A0A7W7MYD3_9ACTN|nr:MULTISPECIES: CoA pyrophosphatase [Actinomadura]MBB4775776.1 8-oxo-dGTP pyrophosphatase MutT (NUDIX family) [Actinomadura catellatispora]GGU35161.1 coenzyme A pyrophosphatase [Actinomadura livida]